MKSFSEEIVNLITKVLIPAFIAVSISLAVEMKKRGRLSFLNIILSYVIGIGFAYLAGFSVYEHLSDGIAIIVIAVVAISGDKLGNWFVYKFRIDDILSALLDALKKWLLKWFK